MYAINKLLKVNKLNKNEIDFLEINEAFAFKVLACCKLLSMPLDKVNVLGGTLAYSHSYGASGVIILHLLNFLIKIEVLQVLVLLGDLVVQFFRKVLKVADS